VIMLMAPTRESEIRRLESLIPPRESLLKSQTDELNNLENLVDDDEYKELLKKTITTEKSLAGMMEQLQKLRDGGQPDVTFNVKSVLTHELQHAVQDLENFPRGGSPRYAETYTRQHIEDIPKRAGTDMPEVEYNVRVRNQMLEEMYALDRINQLQFLQRYINSDQPTRSARLIENNALSYELTSRERDWLGSKPSRRNKKKYGEYLRRKAQLYQAKILNRFFEEPETIQRALQFMGGHEVRKGNISQADAVQMLRTYNPEALLSPDSYFPVTDPGMNPDAIVHPNWLALGEKPVKNAISRLSRRADKYYADQGIKSEVEKRWKDFEKVRERGIHEPGFSSENEFYYRLAGEAESRAVQDRYRRAVDEDKLLVKDPIPFQQGFDEKGDVVLPGGSYDRPDEQLAFVYPRGQAPSIQAAAAVNVPKSDMGFSSPALRVILGSPKEQMPKEMWLKYLRGNGVKDPELEFSGLGSWLKEQKGQVSKQQLEEYMTTQNQLKIEEVVYGGKDADEDYMVMKYVEQQMNEYEFVPIGQDPAFADDIAEDLEDYIANWKNGYYTKVSHPLLYKNKNVAFETEDEAREFFKAEIENQYVVVDPNGEYVRDSGGTIDIHPTVTSARQEMDYRIESEARRMSHEELMQYTGVEETSQDFYGPVKYGEDSLTTPGGENYRELVLYWDKPGKLRLPEGYSVYETAKGKFRIVDKDLRNIDGKLYDSEAEAMSAMTMPEGYTLIKMPEDHPALRGYWGVQDADGTIVNTDLDKDKVIAEVMESFGARDTEMLWHGSHQFTDKPNPLLHIRFNVRVGADGKKILFIEEIQSDIAKRGQKEGFQPKDVEFSSPKLVELKKRHEKLEKQHNVDDLEGIEFQETLTNQKKEIDALEAAIEEEKLRVTKLPPGTKVTKEKKPGGPEMWKVETGEKFKDRDTFWGMDKEEAIANAKYFIRQVAESGIDRGPFIMDTKDYMELGLKRMILWASDNGFDKVAWTTGEQQMKRYNKLVEGIQELTVGYRNDKYRILGTGVGGNNIDSGDITRKQLDDYVGPRVANQVDEKLNEADPSALSDHKVISKRRWSMGDGDEYLHVDVPVEDLKLPQDPKHFLMVAYDKTLKNVAQSLGKKYDARVGVGEVTVADAPMVQLPGQEGVPDAQIKHGIGDPIKEQVWTLNLSEKLKSAAKQGLPYMAAVPPGALLYQKQQERDRTPVYRAAARPLAMQANVQ